MEGGWREGTEKQRFLIIKVFEMQWVGFHSGMSNLSMKEFNGRLDHPAHRGCISSS